MDFNTVNPLTTALSPTQATICSVCTYKIQMPIADHDLQDFTLCNHQPDMFNCEWYRMHIRSFTACSKTHRNAVASTNPNPNSKTVSQSDNYIFHKISRKFQTWLDYEFVTFWPADKEINTFHGFRCLGRSLRLHAQRSACIQVVHKRHKIWTTLQFPEK